MAQHQDDFSNTFPLPLRNHTSLLLAAALPFLQPYLQQPTELIIKFLELSETMKAYRQYHRENTNPFSGLLHEFTQPQGETGFSSLVNRFVSDIEGLLCSLSKVCSGSEQEFIQLFLNILRAKSFFDTYGDLINLGSLFPEGAEGFETSGSEETFPGDFSSFLNKEQQETIALLKNLFSTE